MPRGRPRIHPPRDPSAPRRPRGRPKKYAGANAFASCIFISNQRVTWSFIRYVYKRLGCDWDAAIDAFWKARNTTGDNGIYRYIMAGFKPSLNRPAYITQPSAEREAGKMESIRDWWLKFYTPRRREAIGTENVLPLPQQPYHEIKSMIDMLTEKFSL